MSLNNEWLGFKVRAVLFILAMKELTCKSVCKPSGDAPS